MTDHEKRIREALEAGPVQYACHVDGDVDKSCAFDPGQNVYDCVLATRLSVKGLCKTDCAEWQPVNAPKSTVEVSAANLRALLADLDAMRGALGEAEEWVQEYVTQMRSYVISDSAAKSLARIRAALKGATA